MKRLLLVLLFFVMCISCFSQSQTEFWGMTPSGGNGVGVIFKTDENGNNQQVIKEFIDYPGAEPQYSELCMATNGKLYGVTVTGGAYNLGVLFEYDPVTSTYIKKFDFAGFNSGWYPYGSLMQASNGKLYGMTYGGGTNSLGVLFEYDPATSIYVKKLDFAGATNGSHPYGSLMQATNGKLYGMTYEGGTSNDGVLFEYDVLTSTYVKKLDFVSVLNGSHPYGSLMQASNGKLYGMTQVGGTNSGGVLFEYDVVTSTFINKFDFASVTNGRNPYGSLTQASNGKLYGMTYGGGIYSGGVLFEYDPATSIYVKKLDFAGTTNGRHPYGSLMQASNGKLYGMTYEGGAIDAGVLFEYDPTTSYYSRKLDFTGVANGGRPQGSLIQAPNGRLYGMTWIGGINNMGVLFEYDPSTSAYVKKFNFADESNGSYPEGSLLQASNGKLYGMTGNGGASDYGVLFEYDLASSTYIKKFDFAGSSNGKHPKGSLIQASNGKLYGMTREGGASDLGVLFEYDLATSIYTKKIVFAGATNGKYPEGSLMQASNGKLYGMTIFGGASDYGVLFEYDPATSIYDKKLDFDIATNGSYPNGSLMQASNGKLYGTTYSGGTNNMGVLFEFDPTTSTYVKKFDFADDTNGKYPKSSLVQASNGKLYGMTNGGGTNNTGVLFEFDPTTSTYVKKIDFVDSTNGSSPIGSLMLAPNGKLYGMTQWGGTTGSGVFFEFNPTTSTYVKTFDFDRLNGEQPKDDITLVYSLPQFTCFIPNSVVPQDSNAFFIVSATGNGLSYQWQVNDGSKGFVDLANNVTYGGVTNDTLHLTDVDCSMNNNRYRCVVTSTQPLMSIVSNEATLITTSSTYNESMEICEGESYLWQGNSYDSSGIYQVSYQSVSGCDSIYFLQLVVHPSSLFSSVQDICDGEVYNWRGTDYFTTGIYQDSLLSTSGCDSVYILDLTVHSIVQVEIVGLDSLYCLYNSPDSISSNLSGGVFSGQGVSGSIFNPAIAGIGNWSIVYLYTDSFGCESSDTMNVVVDACLGLNGSENSYHIYPNPTSAHLNIELPDAGNYTISLINSMGQIVLVQQVSGKQQTEADFSGFSQGVYTLKIENAEGFVLKRVVVER